MLLKTGDAVGLFQSRCNLYINRPLLYKNSNETLCCFDVQKKYEYCRQVTNCIMHAPQRLLDYTDNTIRSIMHGLLTTHFTPHRSASQEYTQCLTTDKIATPECDFAYKWAVWLKTQINYPLLLLFRTLFLNCERDAMCCAQWHIIIK